MKYFYPFFLLLFLNSCGSTLHYLGESYEPTAQVDVYYNQRDISQDYITIGHMSEDAYGEKAIERVKQQMIAKAKEKGGHAVLFKSLEKQPDFDSPDGDVIISADVLRYRE